MIPVFGVLFVSEGVIYIYIYTLIRFMCDSPKERLAMSKICGPGVLGEEQQTFC